MKISVKVMGGFTPEGILLGGCVGVNDDYYSQKIVEVVMELVNNRLSDYEGDNPIDALEGISFEEGFLYPRYRDIGKIKVVDCGSEVKLVVMSNRYDEELLFKIDMADRGEIGCVYYPEFDISVVYIEMDVRVMMKSFLGKPMHLKNIMDALFVVDK